MASRLLALGLLSATVLATPFPDLLRARQDAARNASGSLYQNDILLNLPCRPFALIFARGTTEEGNMGITVGPALDKGLNTDYPNQFNIQGVNFDASWENDVDQGGPGGPNMESLVEQSNKNCPDQKIILSGYSEGAMVVHTAVNGLSASALTSIAGVVTFGDPDQKWTGFLLPISKVPKENVLQLCYSGSLGADPLCSSSGLDYIGIGHLAYVGAYTNEAIAWIGNHTVT